MSLPISSLKAGYKSRMEAMSFWSNVSPLRKHNPSKCPAMTTKNNKWMNTAMILIIITCGMGNLMVVCEQGNDIMTTVQ